jgi:hypothetical protein
MSHYSKYLGALKSVHGLVGTVGVLVPGLATFLSNYAPPPRTATAPLTAALAGATLVATYYYTGGSDHSAPHKFPPLVRRAIYALGISVILLIIYIRVLGLLTVETRDGLRFQIGFYTADFGLTSRGSGDRFADLSGTPYTWLRDDGLLYSDGPSLFWTWWAIGLSALITNVLFIFSFALWTHGWALLAKQRTLDDDRQR